MLTEGQMRRFYQVAVACGLLVLLGACARTTALEPQDQLLDTSQARIYFFRQTRSPTDMGGFAAADIRIDCGRAGRAIATLDEVLAREPNHDEAKTLRDRFADQLTRRSRPPETTMWFQRKQTGCSRRPAKVPEAAHRR